MSRTDWQKKNLQALDKLLASLPKPFPAAVWRHALSQPRIPETPTRALDSYWRTHPLRADTLARALAARSGTPAGWHWRVDAARVGGLPQSFRVPPTPFREEAFARGSGTCCICGQAVFRFGWHRDLWRAGRPNPRASWHLACVSAWRFWNQPSEHLRLLKGVQGRRCAETGRRLAREAEVDHRVPLYQVWREHRDVPWPDLIGFWGRPNLQVVNRKAHQDKCAVEARERAERRASRTARSDVGRPCGVPVRPGDVRQAT